jgi:hypothetical protein
MSNLQSNQSIIKFFFFSIVHELFLSFISNSKLLIIVDVFALIFNDYHLYAFALFLVALTLLYDPPVILRLYGKCSILQ